MSGKQDKLQGTPVSKEEVIAELGRPSAEWSRNSRQLEFKKRLVDGHTELSIGGLRSVAQRVGYIDFLERERQRPLGSDTGLVSDAENALIRAEAVAEIEVELRQNRERLALLEQSAEAVAEYLGGLKSWLAYLEKQPLGEPNPDDLEIIQELDRDIKADTLAEIAAYRAEIMTYDAKLAALKRGQS